MMKVWHDDVRPPPKGWVWAKTNAEAEILLTRYRVEEISIDHDLGLEGLDPEDPDTIFRAGSSPNGSGLDLVQWMIENKRVPAKVSIHSWNPDGARKMAAAFNDAGFDCVVSPFKVV